MSLNDLPDSSINQVNSSYFDSFSFEVARNNCVFQKDLRQPNEIARIILTAKEDIENFEICKTEGRATIATTSKVNAKLDFYNLSEE